jgi:hypothetical protein
MPKGDDTDMPADLERLTRLARSYVGLRGKYNVLEHEHRYPMLERMLNTRASARSRAEAALEYAEQVLREDGLKELAKRVRKIKLDRLRPGAPRKRWPRKKQEALIDAFRGILSSQGRISISKACERLASQEPWRSGAFTAAGLRNQFNYIAQFSELAPTALAKLLAEQGRADPSASRASGSRPPSKNG